MSSSKLRPDVRSFVVALIGALAITVFAAGGALAATDPSVLGLDCVAAADNSFRCGSDGGSNAPAPTTRPTWDGMPIDISATLPDPAVHGDGPHPLVMMFHGYSQGKVGFAEQKHYSDKGYAVFSLTARGFRNSCGNAATVDSPGCSGQYVRLLDTRYEVRDAQFFAGELVDEGWVQPDRIAAYGGSYGGGMSMALAALRNRTMLPDGSLIPWESPAGTPLSLAVATPLIPWSDLAYSQVPNGRTLDYLNENPYDRNHFGVVKQSLINGLFRSGNLTGRYAPAGVLPGADLAGWLNLIDQGEPYQGNPAAEGIIDELTRFHSSYYIPPTTSPAPLLIFNGFGDDLFPVDEAIRFYNRTRTLHPDSEIGLMFGDVGHQRSQNKADVSSALGIEIDRWIDHYLGGSAYKPEGGVSAYTVTCPKGAPSGGPFKAGDWASISPGEITVEGGPADQTISPDGGDPAVAGAFNPTLGPGACANPSGAKEPGAASYDSPPAPASGFTMIGSPTVLAEITVDGGGSQIAARLVDVAPDGTKRLVARQLYRPDSSGYQVFQLHPGSWKFEGGHVARLELLPKDASSPAAPANLTNYGRPSNGQRQVTVSDLVLRLPVVEQPGQLGGMVTRPASKVLPEGRAGTGLAPGYADVGAVSMAEYANSRRAPSPSIGRLRPKGPLTVRGRFLKMKLTCAATADSCGKSRIAVRGKTKKRNARGNRVLLARRANVRVKAGKTRSVRFKLTGRARRLFRDPARRAVRRSNAPRRGLRSLRVEVKVDDASGTSTRALTVKRRGRVS